MQKGRCMVRCGAKCFQVEWEVDGKKYREAVKAKTSIEARKAIRSHVGTKATIVSVKPDKK